ncbi:MAG: glycosyltransferase family 4 protein [Candidatus Omnitrophota bacterium]
MKDEFRKLKIVYHHRTQGKGAEGVHIREIIKALEVEGHTVYVVNPPGINVLMERDEADVFKKSWLAKFWSISSKYAPQVLFEILEVCYNFVAFYAIKKIVEKENIDFIYERNAFFCWAGTAVARKFNIPIFIEVNEVSGIERIRGQVLTKIAKKIEQFNFHNAYAIIVVSEFLKKHIANMGINEEKIHVMPNAVDIKKFQSNENEIKTIKDKFKLGDKIVLGFVGSFVKWHNFDLLFNVLKETSVQLNKNICLLVVGDGPLRESLKLKVKELGIEGKVIFTGKVLHAQVPQYINTMDICIIPHANEYRSPIKLFEYMAMGKTVVVPKVEPIESIITHSENGWIFELDNKDSLFKSLKFLIENKNIQEEIGKNARDLVFNQYLWSHNAQRLLSLYYNY